MKLKIVIVTVIIWLSISLNWHISNASTGIKIETIPDSSYEISDDTIQIINITFNGIQILALIYSIISLILIIKKIKNLNELKKEASKNQNNVTYTSKLKILKQNIRILIFTCILSYISYLIIRIIPARSFRKIYSDDFGVENVIRNNNMIIIVGLILAIVFVILIIKNKLKICMIEKNLNNSEHEIDNMQIQAEVNKVKNRIFRIILFGIISFIYFGIFVYLNFNFV